MRLERDKQQHLIMNANWNIKERNYWLHRLSGDFGSVCFPYDFKKVGSDTYQPYTVKFKFDNQLFSNLMAVGNKSDDALFVILMTGLAILLHKYTGSNDILVGCPIYKQDIEGEFINTILPVRNQIRGNMTVKELLIMAGQTFVEDNENQNYPIQRLLSRLNLDSSPEDDFPLFDIAILLENIHDREYIRHIPVKMSFIFSRNKGSIDGRIEYNPCFYRRSYVERIAHHLTLLLHRGLANLDLPLADISLLSEEEKRQLLTVFNDTKTGYPPGKTIHGLFAEKAREIPEQTTLSFYFYLSPIYEALRCGKINNIPLKELENCCFRKNPFIFQFQNPLLIESLDILDKNDQNRLIMLRTHKLDYAAVNKPTLLLLDYFDGTVNLKSILHSITGQTREYVVYTFEKDEYTDFSLKQRSRFTPGMVTGVRDIVELLQVLFVSHLIELVDYSPVEAAIPVPSLENSLHLDTREPVDTGEVPPTVLYGENLKFPVLLLGDRVGQATTGLLYIASFLRRHGVEAYCRWNDMNPDLPSLIKDIETLISRIQPQVVGVSMKWFPHIARVLEICKIVKAFNPSIKVVVGGNTASYFNDKIIKYDWVDYVVLGDGEVPFLHICTGEKEIPNCLYKIKENGKIKIIETPITYVQNEKNSSDIFLSHLDKVFVNQKDPSLAPYFYINTGKGCAMQCLYCAGCKDAQKKIFNRDKPFLRGVEEVRKDLKEAMKYTSTLWFDFDLPLFDTGDYYKKIWEGLDLSAYFCEFYFWKLSAAEFIDAAVKTFKYVYFNIDLCSLSEPHRLKLASAGLVKPQPTDEELFSFFDQCERYDSVEVIINQISGLPWFTDEDIERSKKTLSLLHERYSTLKEMDWGRLHAQPGAPITHNYTHYDMHCYAKSFEEFLHFSELNLKEEPYPTLENFHYPFIYYKDDRFNSKISQFYADTNSSIRKYIEEKEKRKQPSVVLDMTYNQLDEQSNRWARALIKKGLRPGDVVGIMMDRSIQLITGMLAILKAGGAYLPLDPNYPQERIDYMIKDSRAKILLKKSETQISKSRCLQTNPDNRNLNEQTEVTTCTVLNVEALNFEFVSNFEFQALNFSPSNLAYIIYTSGTTGKPKGVMVTHQNVVRLVKEMNYIDFIPGDKLLMTGSSVFDISTFEIWGSLLNGINLFLADHDTILDSEKMAALVIQQGITILHLIPQLFSLAVSQCPRLFAGLRYFMVGGDLVRPAYINQLRDMYHDLKILHMYGPTENTTFSTFLLIDRDYESRLPIGKPISNSTVYILDEFSGLVPIGAVGELWVGGSGVAQGYLNNPELTAERFIFAHSSWSIADRKAIKEDVKFPMSYQLSAINCIYKTGDLARWLPDGNIEFLGRKDTQVKIRGIRIEPGEIENQLLEHEHIKEAVVIAVNFPSRDAGDKENNDKYLCAYFVSHIPIPDPHIQLSQFLLKSLPEALIPSYFVPIDHIPLTPNHKIDRKALPAPTTTEKFSFNVDLAAVSSLMQQELAPVLERETPNANEKDGHITLEHLIAYLASRLQNDVLKRKITISGVDIGRIPGEKSQLNQQEYPTAETYHHILRLLEHQVKKNPHHTAVIDGSRKVTYLQLNETANQLTHVLREKGFKPGNYAGLMVERSVEMIAGILGILKASGSFVEIDPGLESREIDAILTKYQALFLVTRTSSLENHWFTVLQHLTFNENILTRTGPRPQVLDFDSIPIPNRSLVNYEIYNRYLDEATVTNSLSLQATRGCPYHCLYCHKIWPKRHVVRSAENIFAEIKLYYDMGVRRFSFIDDIFNLDVKNSSKVYELIINQGMKPQLLFPSGLRGDLLTKDYIDLMVQAGTSNISIALETASPRLQKLLKKNINLEKLNENLNYFCRQHPHIMLGLFTMHGFPTETEEEAMMTFNFIKNLKWIHFPYINILKIFPNTDMEELALKSGISKEAIEHSADLTYHELPDTLPFDKNFTSWYQAEFLKEYVLSKERLLHVLPYQMKTLTRDEFLMAYRSIFNIDMNSFDELLDLVGFTKEELGVNRFLEESSIAVLDINRKMQEHFPPHIASPGALRVLLLDLSQFFTGKNDLFNELVEAPLGLMYLMTYLYRELGPAVQGKIAKSMIDFDNFNQLKTIMQEFQPEVLGIRALTLHQNFLHETVTLIRQWGFAGPIICGGPYATSSYVSLLQDKHIDLVVLGEGEITFCEIIREIIKNQGKLPGEDVLNRIPGIAFNPKKTDPGVTSREIILLDHLERLLMEASVENPGFIDLPDQMHRIFDVSSYPSPPGFELATAFVFDSNLPGLTNALHQGKMVYIVPRDIPRWGIRLLEFYQNHQLTDSNGIPIFIRMKVDNTWEIGLISASKTNYTPPRSELEKKIAEIWQSVLKVEQVGIDDNFFQLGGHSLNATILLAKIRRVFQVDLRLAEIFKSPTIRGLSQWIRTAGKDKYSPIQPLEKREYYPLSYNQKRLWLINQLNPEEMPYNIWNLITMNHAVAVDAIQNTLHQLVEHHEAFRTGFKEVKGEPIQLVVNQVKIPLKIIDISSMEEKEKQQKRSQIIKEETKILINLSAIPLFRCTLIKLDEERFEFIYNMHHIISDGWSVEILTKEFMRLYKGYRKGKKVQSEALPVQYKDFAAWHLEKLKQPEVKEKSHWYWRRKLEEGIPGFELPGDFENTRGNRDGAAYWFGIENEIKGGLKQLAETHNTTLFMVLFAAYNILLARFAGKKDVVCSIINAGRDHDLLHNIVGYFINSIPIISYVEEEERFIDFLHRVKTNVLEAFECQAYPFEQVLENLKIKYPYVPVALNMGNIGDMTGVEIKSFQPYHIKNSAAYFDIVSYISEFKNGISVSMNYNKNLLKPTTIETIAQAFKKLLVYIANLENTQ